MAIDEVLLDIEEKMETAIDYLRKEFRGIRTGRASTGHTSWRTRSARG